MYKNCLYGTFICVVRKTRCCKILKVKIMGQGTRERRRATCLDDIKEQTQTNLFYCVKHFVVSRIKDISSCVRRRKTNRKKKKENIYILFKFYKWVACTDIFWYIRNKQYQKRYLFRTQSIYRNKLSSGCKANIQSVVIRRSPEIFELVITVLPKTVSGKHVLHRMRQS